MARWRRKLWTRKELVWGINEWQRAWDIAMWRIEGAPARVASQKPFHHALDMLDRGFVLGDAFLFELGVLTIMDCCDQAVEGGGCSEWW
jgi:hypothetical protein